MAENIAENWKAFSGANNWEGLLDEPINPDFLSYLIHYGERVQAIGDAFNFQKLSNTFGLPLFPPEELFSKVGLEKANTFKYEVANYFYLKSDGLDQREVVDLLGSAWVGYVAVTKDHESLGRRDILVCWRGTLMDSEWWQDIKKDLVSATDIFGDTSYDPKMHQGFHNVYLAKSPNSTYNKTSAREQVLAEVRKLVDYYGEKGEEVSITVAGHSLGAALATINAMDIVANGFNKTTRSGKKFPVTAFAYASPRVGDEGLLNLFNDLTDIHILRISNFLDPVPVIPLFEGYVPMANKELEIDSNKSPYLKDFKPHELEIYLHAIAGYNGQSADFSLVVPRDLALVNKTLDILKDNDNLKVLPNWWDVRNNLMTQHENGVWDIDTDYVADPPSEDDIAVLTKNTLA